MFLTIYVIVRAARMKPASALSYAQLREELKRRGLSAKGNKAELEKRLNEANEVEQNHNTEDQGTSPSKGSPRTAAEASKDVIQSETDMYDGKQSKPSAESSIEETEEHKPSKRIKRSTAAPSAIPLASLAEDSVQGPKISKKAKRSPSESSSQPGEGKERRIGESVEQEPDRERRALLLLKHLCEPDTRLETMSYLSSSRFLFESGNSRSAAMQLLSIESSQEAEDIRESDTKRRFFERAGQLQRLAYRCGIEEAIVGSPSETVEIALRNDFWVKSNMQIRRALEQEVLGGSNGGKLSEKDGDDVLLRALQSYFGSRRPLREIAFEPVVPSAEHSTAVTNWIYSGDGLARSLSVVLVRLAIVAKLELAFPWGVRRRFSAIGSMGIKSPVLLLRKEIDASSTVETVSVVESSQTSPKDLVALLNGFHDRIALGKLETAKALLSSPPYLRLQQGKLAERFGLVVTAHPVVGTEAKTKVPKPIDFGVGSVDVSNREALMVTLQEAFGKEAPLSIEHGNEQSLLTPQGLVINFARNVALISAPADSASGTAKASVMIKKPLSTSQLRALKACLVDSGSNDDAPRVVYVSGPRASGKTELAAQLAISLLTSRRGTGSEATTNKRILVLSARATPPGDLLRKIKRRSLGAVDWLDLYLVATDDNDSPPSLTLDKYIQRLEQERFRVLKECEVLGEEMGVREVSEASKSCSAAVGFLSQAQRLVLSSSSSEVAAKVESLLNRVKMLAKAELFLFSKGNARHGREALKEFLISSFCPVVGVSLWDCASLQVLSSARFDHIIIDDCSGSALDFVPLLSLERIFFSSISSSSSRPRITCFGRNTSPRFRADEQVAIDPLPSSVKIPVMGFASPFMCRSAVSLKEEADIAVALVRYSAKIGYTRDDILLAALTSKQAHVMDEQERTCALSLKEGDITFEDTFVGSPKPRIIICATGGHAFASFILQQLLNLEADAVIVLTCDKTWASECASAGAATDLQLVLGERYGDEYDAELRESTMYAVAKPSDLMSVVASLE